MIKFAIDFDSAYTNIYKLGSGLVLSEPTVAAVDEGDKYDVKAIGQEAYKLIGKTAKNTKIVFPVFEGEIVNERVAAKTLEYFLKKVKPEKFESMSALFAVPCGTTADMVSKYKNVARECGIKKCVFAESPILAAIGQRIPLTDATPCFVIDMAGGTTNVAAVTLDGVIAGISVNFGGNKISADIIDFVAEAYGLQIGLQTAERLKKEIGSLDRNDGLTALVNGRDMERGTPRAISVCAKDLVSTVSAYYDKVADLALELLKKLPPEVSAAMRHEGIYVTGGASDVYGLEKYYADKFGMKVNMAENGLMNVALGGGIAIGNVDLLKKITLKT
ncbi:MAG: rod shape-determining protein [Clostridia bacterium]|nr:rod shape-determining protein [Clostridia bacterium]